MFIQQHGDGASNFLKDCNIVVTDGEGCTSIPNSLMPENLTTQDPKASGHTLMFAALHDEAMEMVRQLTVDEVYTQVIMRRTVKLAHCDNDGAETFHEHDQETTVATGVNIKNLTYYGQPGRPKAKGSASDLFLGAGANFGKRISEAHIMTNPDGRKWLESHTQPSTPVYVENFEAFYLYCVQQIHRAGVNTLLVKKRNPRQLAYVAPPVAPTIIWVRNLLDMALAGFNINSPAAIHADLQYKNSIKVPTTTATLNTLVAWWNNNCAPLYQSRGAAQAKIPFADYKI